MEENPDENGPYIDGYALNEPYGPDRLTTGE
jgi:hypothetical protein